MLHPAVEMSQGDGVDVNRLFPVSSKMMNYDPFVLWDNFNLGPDRGFPTHPHRGFEAITYMFSGSIEHKDNLGNHSTVTAGGAQRFTAGLEKGASLSEKVPKYFRGFIYLLNGQIKVNTESVEAKEAFFFESIELDIEFLSKRHFMLCMGKPHGEPIKQYGPFVD